MKPSLTKSTNRPGLTGCISGLTGRISPGLTGCISGLTGCISGLRGCISGLRGCVSGITGDLDDCDLTDAERAAGLNIADLVRPPTDSTTAKEN